MLLHSAVEDARRVANRLGIPYYVLNFADVFAEQVIDHFADEYLRGPDAQPVHRLQQKVKFGTLLEKALELGCDYVATGHYARVERDEAPRPLPPARGGDDR